LREPCTPFKRTVAGHRWLTPVILAAWETEIRRIEVRSQPREIVHKTLSRKKPITKKGLVEWLKVQAQVQTPRLPK
jgi:hypothetical protein